jgi:protein-glutamine gamma-glutamyltransferase
MRLAELHRRITAAVALAALAAFTSGAGVPNASPLVAAGALVLAFLWQPSRRLSARLEPVWRIAALALAVRAFYHVLVVPQDVVLPMVDLLLLLLCAEALRRRDASGDARLHSLSFALLVASAAYRPGVGFAAAFVMYVALTTVALLIGHVRRQTERRRIRNVRVRPRFLLQTAALSFIVIAVSGSVFVAFPRVSRGWVSRGIATPRPLVGFGDRVSLGEHGARLQSNPEVVLRVEFPDDRPPDVEALYWRGRSYDHFDGVRWGRSSPYAMSPSVVEREWPGGELRQLIYGLPLQTPVLFGLHPITRVRARSRIQPIRDGHGDYLYLGSAEPVYSVTSRAGRPAPHDLRALPRGLPPGATFFLQLPEIDPRIAALADSLTAGVASDYDRVLAIQNWLRTRFSYTLDLPATAREATLAHFLFERRAGHCEYFSTALAVLLRTQGIATRNVNGFLGGDWNDFGSYLTVTQNQAHSWVEAWFPGAGWVPFDATPAAGPDGGPSGRAGLGPFRFLVDGLEHRWNKWILDYDLEKQFDLVRGAADAFTDVSRAAAPTEGGLDYRRLALFGVLIVVLVVVARAGWRRRPHARSPEADLYLKLRVAYERAGLTATNLPPLAFRAALLTTDAPGAGPAGRAVGRYVEARFAGRSLAEGEWQGMRADARAALVTLRKVNGWRWRLRQRAPAGG